MGAAGEVDLLSPGAVRDPHAVLGGQLVPSAVEEGLRLDGPSKVLVPELLSWSLTALPASAG